MRKLFGRRWLFHKGEATEKVKAAADPLGLRMLDHFIIAGITGQYASLREAGYMK